MFKNIIKEIIIVLLLMLAIILILGVLLYEYLPQNKVIPEKISYTTPEDVQAELAISEDTSTESLTIDYSIDSTDLTNYKRTKDYVAGKKNPFSSLQSDEVVTESNSTGTTTTSSGASSTNSTSSATTSQSSGSSTNGSANSTESTSYLPNKGTK